METKAARKQKPGRPHSELAGEGLLASGARATVYRALLDLTCSRCGGLIREGTLFTRGTEAFSGLPLVRRCRACEPFTAGKGLLEVLLAPGGAGPARASEKSCAREKALARLGPALASGRRRRGGKEG